MANMIQFDEFGQQRNPNCAACEEMLLDAADGLLSDADQAFFDRHLSGCVPCMQSYAEVQRGAAWLDLLKTQRPQPSNDLVDRIMARTADATADSDPQQNASSFEIAPELLPLELPVAQPPANILPFVPRPVPVSRFTRFTRLAMEPRFAMTAAMAFFSIALTLNLTGVRLDQIHVSDLNPLHLRRTYYEANAQAIRYYDNLRVVRVVESRVDDIRQAQSDSRSTEPTPAQQPERKPDQKQQEKPQEPHGTSRRDNPFPSSLQNARFDLTPDRLRRSSSHAAAFVTPGTKEGGLA